MNTQSSARALKAPQLSSPGVRFFSRCACCFAIVRISCLASAKHGSRFVMRWQQFTGPIMAKAFEDTFLYVFNPLISLNEVGGDPRPSTAPVADFPGYVKIAPKRLAGRDERVHHA